MSADTHSTTPAGAAGFEAYHHAGAGEDWTRPTRVELARETDDRKHGGSAYDGTCGGCDQPVRAFVGDTDDPKREGSCLWTGGPWHPTCREQDPDWIKLGAVRPVAPLGMAA